MDHSLCQGVLKSSQWHMGMMHVCVWGMRVGVGGELRGGGGWGGGGVKWKMVFVGVSYVCANVCVCICHSRNCKKIYLVSKDKNKVLSLEN